MRPVSLSPTISIFKTNTAHIFLLEPKRREFKNSLGFFQSINFLCCIVFRLACPLHSFSMEQGGGNLTNMKGESRYK